MFHYWDRLSTSCASMVCFLSSLSFHCFALFVKIRLVFGLFCFSYYFSVAVYSPSTLLHCLWAMPPAWLWGMGWVGVFLLSLIPDEDVHLALCPLCMCCTFVTSFPFIVRRLSLLCLSHAPGMAFGWVGSGLGVSGVLFGPHPRWGLASSAFSFMCICSFLFPSCRL